jgi:dihydrofolate reductase
LTATGARVSIPRVVSRLPFGRATARRHTTKGFWMRKLKLEMQVSLDGFTASANGDVSWMLWPWSEREWPWDEALRRHHIQLTKSSDCIVISGRMAKEGFCDHWERVAADRANPQAVFAAAIVATPKLVATRTIERAHWRNTALLRGDLVAEIARLKAAPGGDILTYGGPTLASALVDAGLIDEVHLLVNPAVVGQGRSMLKDLQRSGRLVPKQARAFAGGMVLLEYAVQQP